MKIYASKIGPIEAKELLSLNTHNRNINDKHVQDLAEDMRSGNWRKGSVIYIADTPKGRVLMDGQHRALAVIQADVTVEMFVVDGLDMEDQQAIDTGMRRSLSDVLTLRGETNSSVLAAAINWYWRRSNGMYRDNRTPTIAQALKVLEDNPDIRECTKPTRSATRQLKIPYGLAVCLYYQMLAIDPDDTTGFWERLETGLEIHEKHPIYLLRRQLEANAVSTFKKLDGTYICAIIIKAWNAYRSGKDMGNLAWRAGGAKPEAFPEMQ